ncbi:MAG: cytochrome b5 domain-containing protein [Candidatus Bathyarchaeia archaeon]|jgi:arsenite oxidase small subunit
MNEDKLKKFASEDLKQFDGLNGHPLYIVFKGKIYDLTSSKLWPQGKHMGMHSRSEDLTEAIKSAPHGEDNVYRYPLVGELVETTLQAPTPTILEKKPAAPQDQLPIQPKPAGMERREFLKLAAAAGGAITIAAVLSTFKAATFVPKSTSTLAWPTVTVTNINQLTNLTPLIFNYPLTNTPNILVKLGVAAANGIGPNGDIVAFSAICQHLGCQYSFISPGGSPVCNSSYKAAIPMGYCCCHGSQYDFVHGAKVIGGPAPRPVPMVQLQFNSATGNINAVSMGAPTIFGHGPPGTTDPTQVMQYDLQGGDLVTQSTVLE